MKRTYGRWTVLQRAGSDKHRVALWLCRCTCGTVRSVLEPSLVKGESKSCGCLQREILVQCTRSRVQPLAVRFWAKVDKHGPMPHAGAVRVHPEIAGTRCWLWTGGIGEDSYGKTSASGKAYKAHRVAWFVATGHWPKPNALHKCDNRPCVRFSHLFEGTDADNVKDMIKKGRHRW